MSIALRPKRDAGRPDPCALLCDSRLPALTRVAGYAICERCARLVREIVTASLRHHRYAALAEPAGARVATDTTQA